MLGGHFGVFMNTPTGASCQIFAWGPQKSKTDSDKYNTVTSRKGRLNRFAKTNQIFAICIITIDRLIDDHCLNIVAVCSVVATIQCNNFDAEIWTKKSMFFLM